MQHVEEVSTCGTPCAYARGRTTNRQYSISYLVFSTKTRPQHHLTAFLLYGAKIMSRCLESGQRPSGS